MLLVFIVVSEVAFSGCNKSSTSDYLKKKQVQDNAIAALADFGARIKSNVNIEDMGIVQGCSVDLSQVQITPEIMDQLKLLDLCLQLNLSKTSLNDSQLIDLIDQKILDSVMELDLSHNPGITDQTVEKLANLLLLRDLNLVGTHITKAGIDRLQEQRQASPAIIDTFKKPNIHH